MGHVTSIVSHACYATGVQPAQRRVRDDSIVGGLIIHQATFLVELAAAS